MCLLIIYFGYFCLNDTTFFLCSLHLSPPSDTGVVEGMEEPYGGLVLNFYFIKYRVIVVFVQC